MKKRLACLFAVLLIFGFCGCNRQQNAEKIEDFKFVKYGNLSQTIDFIDGTNLDSDSLALLSSLKAVVNKEEVRLYVAETEYNWPEDLGLDIIVYEDPYLLVEKYAEEIEGIVLYDKNNIHTLNLAFAEASVRPLIVCSYLQFCILEARDINIDVKEDYRNRFTSAESVYSYLYDNLWGSFSKDVVAVIKKTECGGIRDYLTATGIVALSPEGTESKYLDNFFNEVSDDCYILTDGEYSAKDSGISALNISGCENLMFFSGLGKVYPRTETQKNLQNKIYVSLVISYENDFGIIFSDLRKSLSESAGKTPINIALNSLTATELPALLNWYIWEYKNVSVLDELAEYPITKTEEMDLSVSRAYYNYNKYNKNIPEFLVIKADARSIAIDSIEKFAENAATKYGNDIEFVTQADFIALKTQAGTKYETGK